MPSAVRVAENDGVAPGIPAMLPPRIAQDNRVAAMLSAVSHG